MILGQLGVPLKKKEKKRGEEEEKKEKRSARNGVIHHRIVTKPERANEYPKLHSTERDFERSIRSRRQYQRNSRNSAPRSSDFSGCVRISRKLGIIVCDSFRREREKSLRRTTARITCTFSNNANEIYVNLHWSRETLLYSCTVLCQTLIFMLKDISLSHSYT